MKKRFFILYAFLLGAAICNAQIEVAKVSVKDFKATGFGAFLNFSFPVSEASYLTLEGGLQFFKDKTEDELALIPVLLGYRYTLNKSGSGLYIEPNAGYCFASSTIVRYTENGNPINNEDGSYAHEKIAAPMAGVGVGYLFEPGEGIQFNVGARYERTFGNAGANVLAFRISHAFTFGRRND